MSNYVQNSVLRFREGNRDLPAVETVAQVKALIDAAQTASKSYIEVTVTRQDTQFLSPTPINTVPEKKSVTQKVIVILSNLVLVQDGANHAPVSF
jgi:hypothetical protein